MPAETAVAFTYHGSCYAVLMATPADLEDLAVGFSLTEGIVAARDQIESLEVIETPLGIELRLWLTSSAAKALHVRRRHAVGPTGCGLCGIESLEEAARGVPAVPASRGISAAQVMEAVASMVPLQRLNFETRAVHAAAFWTPAAGIVALREDVGRHNALDKLAGALACDAISTAVGAVVLTSRVSVEMVQKAAFMGAPILVAMSAPTALALRAAEAAGITLIGVARGDGFEVFTHPDRISPKTSSADDLLVGGS